MGSFAIRCSPGAAPPLLPLDDEQSLLAARLICDVGFKPVDAGRLRIARYTEPFSLLVAQLAYEGEGGPGLAYRFEWFEEQITPAGRRKLAVNGTSGSGPARKTAKT